MIWEDPRGGLKNEERRCGMTIEELNEAIKKIRAVCHSYPNCVECPLKRNCNECPGDWQEVTNNDVL